MTLTNAAKLLVWVIGKPVAQSVVWQFSVSFQWNTIACNGERAEKSITVPEQPNTLWLYWSLNIKPVDMDWRLGLFRPPGLECSYLEVWNVPTWRRYFSIPLFHGHNEDEVVWLWAQFVSSFCCYLNLIWTLSVLLLKFHLQIDSLHHHRNQYFCIFVEFIITRFV